MSGHPTAPEALQSTPTNPPTSPPVNETEPLRIIVFPPESFSPRQRAHSPQPAQSPDSPQSAHSDPGPRLQLSDAGSDTETAVSNFKMSSRSDKHTSKSSSSKSNKSGSPKSSSKPKGKDDWSEVNEPDERRRIQNRIAQRKFREKAKESRESSTRDAENQARAGYIYSTPEPDDMGGDYNLSGLPWGGPSIKHIVERGKAKERESQQGSQERGGSGDSGGGWGYEGGYEGYDKGGYQGGYEGYGEYGRGEPK